MAPKKRIPKINVGEFPYVDIMPASRKEAIDKVAARTKWIKFVSYGVALGLVISAGSFGFKFYEQINYDGAVKAQTAVEAEIAANADIDTVLTIRDTITGNVLRASAATINWQELMNRISTNLPANSVLTSFEVNTGGTAKDKPAAAVLVSISSQEPIAYRDILSSFNKIEGIVDGSLQIGNLFAQEGSTPEDVSYIYPVAFSVDGTILADLFAYLTGDAEAPVAPEKIQGEEIEIPLPEPTESQAPTSEQNDTGIEENVETTDGVDN